LLGPGTVGLVGTEVAVDVELVLFAEVAPRAEPDEVAGSVVLFVAV
jgi:hypothetical protein